MNQYNNWIIKPNITDNNHNEEKIYLKSEDKISIENENKEKIMILHSHDIKYALDNSLYQEVFCHDHRINSKDEVREELKRVFMFVMFKKKKKKIFFLKKIFIYSGALNLLGIVKKIKYKKTFSFFFISLKSNTV